MLKTTLMAFCIALVLSGPVFADQEAGNRVYVQSAEYGLFYAKSVPAEPYGLKGRTEIYQVMPEKDQLLHTYDWYSPEVYLTGYLAGPIVYTVQFGSWNRDYTANAEDLAVAFYKDGKLLKKYSTLDIVKDEKNVSNSVSHYTVFNKKLGFRRPWGNQIIFDVELYNGEVLSFDTDTGKVINKKDEELSRQFYDIQSRISQIKWNWHEANKDKYKDIDTRVITEAELKAFDPDGYPKAPAGYTIAPNKMWDTVSFNCEDGSQKSLNDNQ